MNMCVFCLRRASDQTPWVKGNPGLGCTYGLAHEYPEALKPVKQPPKVDKRLCVKCGLHPKNPASAASGCAHQYP